VTGWHGLIAADHLHIMRWQTRLAELRHGHGDPDASPTLAATWDTLAGPITLHMAADEEVCGPAIYGTGPHGAGLAQEARDAHNVIRDILPALRARLARQRPFMDAQIRNRYADPPPQIPTCQLRRSRAAEVPRLADDAFAPLACACLARTRELDPVPVPVLAGPAAAAVPGGATSSRPPKPEPARVTGLRDVGRAR